MTKTRTGRRIPIPRTRALLRSNIDWEVDSVEVVDDSEFDEVTELESASEGEGFGKSEDGDSEASLSSELAVSSLTD